MDDLIRSMKIRGGWAFLDAWPSTVIVEALRAKLVKVIASEQGNLVLTPLGHRYKEA